MILKKSFKALIHVGFWLAYIFLIMMIAFAVSQGIDIKPEDAGYYITFVTGVAIIPPVTSFYLHYHYLFPNYLQKRKLVLSVIVSMAISMLALSAGFAMMFLASEEVAGCIRTGYPYAIGFTFLLATIFGVIALVLKGFLTWYEELKMKEELIEKTHRMEMALVKSQLDPHFLFNTINNIDILITRDAEEASRYLNKLSDIMRFMLYETKAEEIPLTKELEYIEKYIQLQKIRTSNGDYVNYEVSGQADAKKVAPMVFIPFIENAFKHSGNKKNSNAVDIGVQIEEDAITFSCRNRFEPKSKRLNGANGLGNELIKRRLRLLYPNRHDLEVERQQGNYSVKLKILNGAI